MDMNKMLQQVQQLQAQMAQAQEEPHPEEGQEPAGEDEIVELMRDTFDAREVGDPQ